MSVPSVLHHNLRTYFPITPIIMPLTFISGRLCPWGSIPSCIFFSYLPHTPFFLCQFLLNWTFCHQTRFITWARVERNSAEIRIRFLLRLGHVHRGFRPCGSFPCRWVRGGGGGSSHPFSEKKGVGGAGKDTERDTERVEGLLGCFTSGLNTQSEALSTYPCHLQTLKTPTLFPACPYRTITADLDCELRGVVRGYSGRGYQQLQYLQLLGISI